MASSRRVVIDSFALIGGCKPPRSILLRKSCKGAVDEIYAQARDYWERTRDN